MARTKAQTVGQKAPRKDIQTLIARLHGIKPKKNKQSGGKRNSDEETRKRRYVISQLLCT